MKKCTRCLTEKETTEFHNNKAKKDGLSGHCKDCQKAYLKAHYDKNKTYYKVKSNKRKKKSRSDLNKLKSSPCKDCGQTYPPYVMDFDHVHGTKTNNVSSISRNSTRLLKEEIEKCELVCANCHRIRTYNRLQKRD